ncbi:gamma-glutamyl phosphate reductase [Nonomuraea sp. PA05]|uniref:acyl-CoA reductase n=1 Tax=Nonomuraea sp. PA05 TaxID=2604466 RepID=UPI0011DABCC5|nr:acyl-CoA reductase [Nonomuraea sp. PA05]TYB47595.1 gamma-glutamyl phosphate reductase [Nonomuraea sp. PA05]
MPDDHTTIAPTASAVVDVRFPAGGAVPVEVLIGQVSGEHQGGRELQTGDRLGGREQQADGEPGERDHRAGGALLGRERQASGELSGREHGELSGRELRVSDGLGGRELQVGDERVREFLAAFGRRLLRPALARRHPELGSLGFFLRPSELARTVEGLAGEHVRVPRGLIFHVPPANVDTVFVYSWALSALMGNRNIVRLSHRSGTVAETILETLHEALADADPAIAATQRVISYDRSEVITAALSAACDLRVVWGGDGAVRDIRRHPLAPHARDLTFPDRSSFAVVRAAAWLCAPRAARVTVAEGFVNDTYWFDQAACSSPRTVFWVGSEGDCDAARADFTAHVARAVTVRGWGVDAAMAVEKRVSTYGLAADGLAESVEFHGNALAVVHLSAAAAAPRRWLGAGTFAHARLGALGELVSLVERRDQTMTHFGFGQGELEELARGLAGRGVDRMVPVGSALSFHRVWDGVDLPAEFTRLVTVIR